MGHSRDYSTEELNAWSPAVPDAAAWAERMFSNRITFVADDHGTVAGFGEFEADGHIDCLYCHHDYQRRGVGAAILRRIEATARTLGVIRLSLFLHHKITQFHTPPDDTLLFLSHKPLYFEELTGSDAGFDKACRRWRTGVLRTNHRRKQ